MKKSDDKKFNETLKNLLNTPPKPHADKTVDAALEKIQKKDGRPARKSKGDRRTSKPIS